MAKFDYKADGTIPNLGWWDKTSAPQVGTLNPYARVEAETIAWTSRIKRDRDRTYAWTPGVTTAKDGHGAVYVTRTADRSYIKVAGVDFGSSGAKTFRASLANGAPGASIELRLDRVNGPVIGTLPVGETGAAKQWHEKTVAVAGATGIRDLYLVFRGGNAPSLVDFDSWRFDR